MQFVVVKLCTFHILIPLGIKYSTLEYFRSLLVYWGTYNEMLNIEHDYRRICSSESRMSERSELNCHNQGFSNIIYANELFLILISFT